MQFPFGKPVVPSKPVKPERSSALILGAYPSALHVEWTPPGCRKIRAIPVDNEPAPFWDGADQEARVDLWKRSVGWKAEWGKVTVPGNLNGPSGCWVASNILEYFRLVREEVLITDCLDSYRLSNGAQKALDAFYVPLAARLGLPVYNLTKHPGENEIVNEASNAHQTRLIQEIEDAGTDLIITLGNAALRTMGKLAVVLGNKDGYPTKLSYHPGKYGAAMEISLFGKRSTWYALAHPASPGKYLGAHTWWRKYEGPFA